MSFGFSSRWGRKTLVRVAVYLAIAAVGFWYAFYQMFSGFSPWDDGGTMMLRVAELVRDPRSGGIFTGVYGPVYYLLQYAVYTGLHLEVSHDINGLTTVLAWGLVAVGTAIFVRSLTRSLVFAAIVQMQLLLHLRAFTNEPGHPHGVALLLITAGLLFSGALGTRRDRLWPATGMGVAIGALLLVKMNLGIYAGIPFGIALLLALPRGWLVTVAEAIVTLGAIALPAVVMYRHFDQAWARNYCALATTAIAASIVVASRTRSRGELKWRHVGAGLLGAGAVVVVVAAALAGWGHSVVGVADGVFLRAATFPTVFVIPAPIGEPMVRLGVISLALALVYAAAAPKLAGAKIGEFLLAVAKLGYGGLAFYDLSVLGPGLLRQGMAVPFSWLVLIPSISEPRSGRFARVFLCLLAAFQTLQAYPVHGSQATWAVYLLAPLAAVCIGDALRFFVNALELRMRWLHGSAMRRQVMLGAGALILAFAGNHYLAKADLSNASSKYQQFTPLGLPGSGWLRLPQENVTLYRWLTEGVKENCDSFIGLPGFASLYFWTRLPPPGPVANAWLLSMGGDEQQAIVKTMATFARPCAIYNLGLVNFWTNGQPVDEEQPLIRSIKTDYEQLHEYGGYKLLAARQ